jgi:hypothetical protein
VGRLGSDHTQAVTFMSFYKNSLPEEHLVEPSTQRKEPQETIVSDMRHHETNLVHMSRKHHARAGITLAADEASDSVLFDRSDGFQVAPQECPYFSLVSRNSVSL